MRFIIAVLRSTLYLLLQIIITPPYALVVFVTYPLSPLNRYRVISGWSHIMLFLARFICGVRYCVLGTENIPKKPTIVLSKHQSAWETLAFQKIFPPQVWVLKKELLHIPFFGWGLAMTSPIAINRSQGKAALKQIIRQGRDRLQKGLWVIIFPEGTRIDPGKKGRYGIGGAWLSTSTGVSVVPVAHNAGVLWGKNSFIKFPGTITVSIGEPIDPAGMEANELNNKVEEWIELEVIRIGDKDTIKDK
ncbi:1-acyl-sn-glycerol-3-phosphate acyltransferase [Nitrosomonadaceae bacterium]|nr:1-acyl-sn-glycerol-3-phosphate acyltransferase [Nitrosomonadaceae bacterium]